MFVMSHGERNDVYDGKVIRIRGIPNAAVELRRGEGGVSDDSDFLKPPALFPWHSSLIP